VSKLRRESFAWPRRDPWAGQTRTACDEYQLGNSVLGAQTLVAQPVTTRFLERLTEPWGTGLRPVNDRPEAGPPTVLLEAVSQKRGLQVDGKSPPSDE
jgi:hypothetical protein